MTWLDDARQAQAERKATLTRALLGLPAEPEQAEPEPVEPKRAPSYDGGARRTPPVPVTQGQFYAALFKGEKPWPPLDPHAGPPNPVA
jgi:hypothetical protein